MAHRGRQGPSIVRIEDAAGADLGRLIGWVFHDRRFVQDSGARITLAPGDGPEDLFRRLGGRFVMLWQDAEGVKMREDSAGNLPAVYAPRLGAVASTVTVLDQICVLPPNVEAQALFQFPKRRGFLPFGLTARDGAHRLMPNHALTLGDLSAARIWPRPQDLPRPDWSNDEIRRQVARVGEIVTDNMAAVLGQGETVFYLSGGHDSRMVLAAALALPETARAHLICETMGTKGGLDSHVAAEVAALAGLPHQSFDVGTSTPEAIAAWIHGPGGSIYDLVTTYTETMVARAPAGHPVAGTGAELGRGTTWTETDFQTTAPVELGTLLARLRLPDQPVVRAAGTAWLDGLPQGADRFWTLDLAKIEQIHGCWAGAGIYGHPLARPSLHPFSGQEITEILMALPPRYRFSNTIFHDYIAALAPRLVGVPVNRARGLNRLKFWKYELRQATPTWLKRWLRPFR